MRRVSALKQRELNAFVDRVDAERSGSILQAGIEPKEWRSVVDKVMAPRTDRQLGVAVAMKGLDSIAGGAQASLSDVDVPLDQAVRRGWGGL